MIRILTDSSSGLTLNDAKKIGVEMVHMPINFDGTEYIDGKDLNHEEFYKKLVESKNPPKTSAINQATFEEIFEDVKKKGEEMVVLLISSGLSVTNDQAMQAKDAVGYDKIYIINSLATVATLIALVMEAVRMRDSKMKGADIAKELNVLVPKAKLFAYVDTLKYLRAGGRISATSAVVGGLLNVKPIIILTEGKLVNENKCVGAAKAKQYLLTKFKEYKNIDFSKPVYFGHAHTHKECENLKAAAKQIHNFIDGGTWYISATVGTHTGPGAVLIAFFEK
ncbi:MAG: DegV family protein [Firmicutes bacterium]|nr:DegV family protein [Bacillota bacterium]MCL2770697.1 DegV family protein [Bacillota bacterium]